MHQAPAISAQGPAALALKGHVKTDILGGGMDLVFPHHENEIAQSCCGHDVPEMAKYWVHNGFVTVDGQKMSKSLGNFIVVSELLERYPGEAIRLALLSGHYRQPLDVTDQRLDQAKSALDRWYTVLRDAPEGEGSVDGDVLAALEDDLNTPEAIAALHALASAANQGDASAALRLKASGAVMGILQQDPIAWLQGGASADGPSGEEIEQLIQARKDARKARDFAAADKIRDDLAAAGVQLEDGPTGTTWRRAG